MTTANEYSGWQVIAGSSPERYRGAVLALNGHVRWVCGHEDGHSETREARECARAHLRRIRGQAEAPDQREFPEAVRRMLRMRLDVAPDHRVAWRYVDIDRLAEEIVQMVRGRMAEGRRM